MSIFPSEPSKGTCAPDGDIKYHDTYTKNKVKIKRMKRFHSLAHKTMTQAWCLSAREVYQPQMMIQYPRMEILKYYESFPKVDFSQRAQSQTKHKTNTKVSCRDLNKSLSTGDFFYWDIFPLFPCIVTLQLHEHQRRKKKKKIRKQCFCHCLNLWTMLPK